MSKRVKLKADSASAKIHTNLQIEYSLVTILCGIAKLSFERNGVPRTIHVPLEDVEQVDGEDTPFLDATIRKDMETIRDTIYDGDSLEAAEAYERIFARISKLL